MVLENLNLNEIDGTLSSMYFCLQSCVSFENKKTSNHIHYLLERTEYWEHIGVIWGSFNTNPNITLAQFLWDADLTDSYETDYYELHYPGNPTTLQLGWNFFDSWDLLQNYCLAGVILTISLRRQLPYHLCQTYLPSVIIVTLAWLSMFVSPDSIPGKINGGKDMKSSDLNFSLSNLLITLFLWLQVE